MISADAVPIVVVRDVFVAFRGPAAAVMALRGADLTVAAGERLVVQGPNGSGKSTLLQVITGEQAVAAGSVQVGGEALHELSAQRRRRWRAVNIGFLDQQARRNLLAEQSVVDNVALQLRLTGTSAGEARRRARAALDELGVGDLATRPVPELSGGEAARVALCCAVAHRPRLVLADEPTAELDESSARAVHEMLSRIAAEGASVILVSHDGRSLEFGDRAVRIRDGRVAEQWRPGSAEVEQLPDSRGWIRVPPELLAWSPGRTGLVASPWQDGVLLRSRPRSGPAPEQADRSAARPIAPAPADGPAAGIAEQAPLVVLRALAASYPGLPLFHGLDLEVLPGSGTVVTGPSGSGKSTLLGLVSGVGEPSSGSLLVGGVDWQQLDRTGRAEARRRWLSFAPQRSSFAEALTLEENLELTAAVRDLPLSSTDLAATAARLRLSPLLRQPVNRLSGGERQRSALARSLMSRAPLLVLDEPTSEQDDASAELVISVLLEEAADGRAILAATHDVRLIRRADQHVDLQTFAG